VKRDAAVDPVTAPARLDRVRLLIGTYLAVWGLVRLPYHLDVARLHPARWNGVGPLAALDAPPPPWLSIAAAVLLVPAAVALAAGWRLRVTAPIVAAVALYVTSLDSSWGQVFHTENLVVLHVLVLAGAALAVRPDPAFVLRLLAVATAATYVVAGVAKLRTGGWEWAGGDVLRHQVAYDNVRKAVLGAAYSPVGGWAVGHRWLFPPLAVLTLAVELGAPLALLSRRAAAAWSSLAWLFHLGVFALMAIAFPYPLSGVAFAPLLPVERLPLPRLLRRTVAPRWNASPSPSA
jgi:hypothetical protein